MWVFGTVSYSTVLLRSLYRWRIAVSKGLQNDQQIKCERVHYTFQRVIIVQFRHDRGKPQYPSRNLTDFLPRATQTRAISSFVFLHHTRPVVLLSTCSPLREIIQPQSQTPRYPHTSKALYVTSWSFCNSVPCSINSCSRISEILSSISRFGTNTAHASVTHRTRPARGGVGRGVGENYGTDFSLK